MPRRRKPTGKRQPGPESPASSTRSRSSLLVPVLLVVSAVAAYSNSFHGTFVLDDIPAIVENENIRSLWPPWRAFDAPANTTVSGRPVSNFSLAVSYALSNRREPSGAQPRLARPHTLAPDPYGFHLLNLAIHIGAGLTLFGIVRRTFQGAVLAPEFGQHGTGLAGTIALLWLLHPLQTGSVTYIVQRVEALMGLFLLLTLYCSIRALDSRSAGRWSFAAVAACALGMGAKETMVGAPLIVVVWDRLFLGKGPIQGRSAARAQRRFLYLALASTWLILGWNVFFEHRPESVGFGFAEWPWWRYLITQAGVILHYLRLSIVPVPLVLDYGWPAAGSVASELPKVAILGGLLALTVFGSIKRSPMAFAGALFFIVLAPSSSVLPIVTEVAAEHRMYVPLAAVLSVIVVGGWLLGQRFRLPRWAGVAATIVVASLLGSLTYARNLDYVSEERIWADTVRKRPANPRAHTNFGVQLLTQRRTFEAESHLRKAVALEPDEAKAHVALGAALCSSNRCEEGIQHFQRGAEINPSDADAVRNLAEAYAARGQWREAAANFKRAIAIVPSDVFMLNQASWLLATAPDDDVRDGHAALAMAEKAVTLTRREHPISLDSLAVAYAELDRFEEAQRTIDEALDVAVRTGARQLQPELLNHQASIRARQKIRTR